MNSSQDESDDRELLDSVGKAFSAQPIPPRPNDEQTLEQIQEALAPTILKNTSQGLRHSRSSRYVGIYPGGCSWSSACRGDLASREFACQAG